MFEFIVATGFVVVLVVLYFAFSSIEGHKMDKPVKSEDMIQVYVLVDMRTDEATYITLDHDQAMRVGRYHERIETWHTTLHAYHRMQDRIAATTPVQ